MPQRTANGLLIIERLLRDREGVWQQIIDERDLSGLTQQMLASSAVSLALYGAVLGASNSWAQALSSTIKLPLLFLATLAICLPTLYLFNLVFGAKLSMMQAVTLILVAVTVTAVLTLAFAPISLFFLISAHSYAFFKLLNVTILTLTAIVGLRFLISGMRTLSDHQEVLHRRAAAAELTSLEDRVEPVPVEAQPVEQAVDAAPNGGVAAESAVALRARPVTASLLPPRPAPAPVPAVPQRSNSMSLLYIWILLFGFVGTQLGWTLRPFFGDPGQPFALFRHIEGTFYADIFRTIGKLFGG
jgi:hypothetical protein